MDILGYNIDTTLEWVATGFLLLLAIVLAFYIAMFVFRYTTGMVGGFIFMIVGMGMVLGPAFYLISTDAPQLRVILSCVSIILGCAAVLVGAFSLTNFRNF